MLLVLMEVKRSQLLFQDLHCGFQTSKLIVSGSFMNVIVLQCAAGGVKAEDLTDNIWDHIFLGTPAPEDSSIPKELLSKMQQEFEYWYPFDMRVISLSQFQDAAIDQLLYPACIQ